ncbi:MAG: cytochrome P450 [Gemmatimonadales bacterium]
MSAAVRPSGPAGSFVTGNLPDFARDPLEFLEKASRDHGPVTSLRFGRTRAVLLSDPDLIEDVLVRKRDSFIKARSLQALHHLFGNGILTSEGEFWRKQRRLIQPAFHPASMRGHAEVVVSRASRMFDGWQTGDEMEFHSLMKELLLSIVADSLFGAELAQRATVLGAALESTMDRFTGRRGLARFAPDWVPLPDTRRYMEGVAALDEFVTEVLAVGRRGRVERKDLLSILLAARDENGNPMSDSQLRDEAITLFVGGFDTPALAMSWTWYLLSKNPDCVERLVAEVDSMLGDRAPGFEDASTLSYTQCVVKESMRLFPPAWIVSREASQDTEVGGYPVPRGTTVMMSQWLAHRDERFFPDALIFRPERWASGNSAKLPRFAYFPFGGGPRVCIGASFAMMETTLILAMLAQRFRFAVRDDVDIAPRATMTLRPRGGVPIVIDRRS